MAAMRSLPPLLLVLVMAAALGADDWSGSFEVVETLTGPGASGDAKRDAEATSHALEERIARTREALKTASPAAAKALRQDLAALEVELEAVALERGGTVVIGRTTYLVIPGRVVCDGDEGRVVADTVAGSAVVLAEGRRETVALVKPGRPVAPRDAAPAAPIAGVEVQHGTLTLDGQPVPVSWAPSLPNVHALTRLPSHGDKGLQAQLATLPGLAMVVERPNPKGGTLRWTVQKLSPGPIDPRLLAP
jgi:hypothetical protein